MGGGACRWIGICKIKRISFDNSKALGPIHVSYQRSSSPRPRHSSGPRGLTPHAGVASDYPLVPCKDAGSGCSDFYGQLINLFSKHDYRVLVPGKSLPDCGTTTHYAPVNPCRKLIEQDYKGILLKINIRGPINLSRRICGRILTGQWPMEF